MCHYILKSGPQVVRPTLFSTSIRQLGQKKQPHSGKHQSRTEQRAGRSLWGAIFIRVTLTFRAKKQKTKTRNMNGTSLSRPPKRLGTVGAHRTNQKSRYWLLTFNFPHGTKPDNLSPQDQLNIRAFNRAAQVHPVTYCVFQGEVGEEEATYHIQAYAEFAQAVTMPTVKKHFGLNSLHCEIRLGTQQQAIAYCTKEETRASEIHEYGTPAKQTKNQGQGKRTDLEEVWIQLKKGTAIADIIEKEPRTMKYISLMQKAQFEALRNMKRKQKTMFTVLYGAAGTGKTSTAIQFAKTLGPYYLMPNDGKAMWWNGYDPMQHETIILDEFNGSKMPLTFLNQLTDAYDLRVQTKGGYLPFVARHVVITSNFHPRDWYDFANHEKNLCWEALERRIDNLCHFRIDVHINENSKGIDLNCKKLHVTVEKGGFNLGYVRSPLELDDPPTRVNTPASSYEMPQEVYDAIEDLYPTSPPMTNEEFNAHLNRPRSLKGKRKLTESAVCERHKFKPESDSDSSVVDMIPSNFMDPEESDSFSL